VGSLVRRGFCSLQSKEGKSPLHMAAIHGRFTRSQILIQNGEWLLPPALGYPSLFLCFSEAARRTSLRVCSEGLRAPNYHSNSLCAPGAVASGRVLLGDGRERACPQGQQSAGQETEIPARSELLQPKNVPTATSSLKDNILQRGLPTWQTPRGSAGDLWG